MDAAFSLLTKTLAEATGNTLLALDENIGAAALASIPTSTTAVTNRYDIWQRANALGLHCDFNDFDFSQYPANHFIQIGFRIAKEKSITHHLINQAAKLLTPGGRLLLSGAKNEGIKSYAKKTAQRFKSSVETRKYGSNYLAVIHKACNDFSVPLDDQEYDSLRRAITLGDTCFYSKPGVFGWNKIDQGSLLLAETLPEFFQSLTEPPTAILDLGCGYGFLSVMASKQVNARFAATDNNAAAIISCKKNFSAFNIMGEAIADDCANQHTELFDIVLCHPPFHRGFDTEQRLTEQFINAAYKRLTPSGNALFVANQFVPLEKYAARYFTRIRRIAENKSFKVIHFAP